MSDWRILVNAKDDPEIPSGYGIIGKHFYPRLGDYYGRQNVIIYAPIWNRDTPKIWEGMKVLAGTQFDYGENLVLEHYKYHGCHMLLQIGDCWPLGMLPDLAAADQLMWVQWIPVDWLGMPANIKNRIRPAHKLIPFSDYGHNALTKNGLTNVGPRIWLGLDLDIWQPMDRRELPEVMASIKFREECFNILIVGRNQERKRLRESLEAIAVFRVVHPDVDVRLYLHTDEKGDRDIKADLDELGLAPIHCGPSPYIYSQGGFSELEMCRIFNCADVVVNVAMEGFGLAQTQAQACGVPVICLAEGAGAELVRFGWEVGIAGKQTAPHQMTQPIPDVPSIAGALEEAWGQRQAQGGPVRSQKAIEWINANFGWDAITQQWIDVIEGCREDKRKFCLDVPAIEEASKLWEMSRDIKNLESVERTVQE